jgi:hypothetical protein
MTKIQGTLFNFLLGLLLLAACAPVETVATVSPRPTAEIKVLPTSSSPSDSIIWRDLQVTMDQTELTEGFVTEYGFTRSPSAGTKFMWAHVLLKNMGQKEIEIPKPEHFSVLYAAAEFKPTYGHRKDYADYFALDPVIFPKQEVDAWLRFDVADSAGLKDLRFVFLPESSQVGVSFSSPNYPYAEDHPTFVWMCK